MFTRVKQQQNIFNWYCQLFLNTNFGVISVYLINNSLQKRMKSHHKGYTLGTRRFSLVLSRSSRRPNDDMFGQRPTHERRKSQSSKENRGKPLTPRV